MRSEARKRSQASWKAGNVVQIKLGLNKNTDADILQKLEEVQNKQGYIKRLIREDISKSQGRLDENRQTSQKARNEGKGGMCDNCIHNYVCGLKQVRQKINAKKECRHFVIVVQ